MSEERKNPPTHKDGVYQIKHDERPVFDTLAAHFREQMNESIRQGERYYLQFDDLDQMAKTRAHSALWYFHACKSIDTVLENSCVKKIVLEGFRTTERAVHENRTKRVVEVKIQGRSPIKTNSGVSEESYDFVVFMPSPGVVRSLFSCFENGKEMKKEGVPALPEEFFENIFHLSFILEDFASGDIRTFTKQYTAHSGFCRDFGFPEKTQKLIERLLQTLKTHHHLTSAIPLDNKPASSARKL